MSRKINFYTISLNRDDTVTDCSVWNFFERIKERMLGEDSNGQVDRAIGEKWIRIFPYYYSGNCRQVVIPFGKLKSKNKPYWLNFENHLEEVPAELFDINSLGYDSDYDVMVFTTNREGPSINDVEEYLNTFIPRVAGVTLKIEPIMYNAGIEKVRNAGLVRSVTLNLDLGHTLNNFYRDEMDANQHRNLIAAFRQIAETAKNDVDSNVLSLTLGLGKHGRKHDTLNLESMLYLLEHINIDGEFIREIIVNYKNGESDKIDTAKLKESNMLLSYNCKCEGTQVSPEVLIGNINTAVADKIVTITRHIRDYFLNVRQYNGSMFNLVERWNNDFEALQ